MANRASADFISQCYFAVTKQTGLRAPACSPRAISYNRLTAITISDSREDAPQSLPWKEQQLES